MNNPLMNNMSNNNPMAMLSQLRQNPLALLQKAGLNVPQNMNNPQEIIQHLMNSGQISQEQVNQAQAKARSFGLM